MENLNTFSMQDGKVRINGTDVHCVTDVSIKCIPRSNCMSVTLSFDVPIRSFNAGSGQEMHLVTGEEINIPVSIGDRQFRSVTVRSVK